MNDESLNELLATAARLRDEDLRSPATHAAAQALLEDILAVHPTSQTDQQPSRPLPDAPVDPSHGCRAATPARSGRRQVLLPAAAVALILAAFVFQGGREGGNAAYASWSAIPASVAGDDLEAASSACEDKLRQFAGGTTSIDPERAELVLAERRGDHVALLYRTDDPDISTTCFLRNAQGTTHVADLEIASGGSTGPALRAPATGFTQGAIAEFDGASITDGAVGDAVAGVTIHTSGLTVRATVENGRYAAWWPGSAFDTGGRAPKLNLTYDLILEDGGVIPNAEPTRPS